MISAFLRGCAVRAGVALALAGCGGGVDPELPDPVLLEVTPDTLDVRQAAVLTLSGEGFAPGSLVRYGSLELRPEYVSARELRLMLSREQAVTPASNMDGTLEVRVFTPPPGGGISGPRFVARNFGVPDVSAVSPSRLAGFDTETVLMLTGTNFTPHTTVYVWVGVDETSTVPYFFLKTETTYLSAERLRFRIEHWSAYHQGTWYVHAGNPPLGGTGTAVPLTVY